jgi:integrase
MVMVSAKPVPMDALQHGQELNPSQSIGTGTLDVESRVNKNLSITRPDELETIPLEAPEGKPTGHQKRKRGRPKKEQIHPRLEASWMPNPYGNNPRVTAIKHYLNETRHNYAPSTQAVRTRNLLYLAGIFKKLGLPTVPKKFTKEDVMAFMDWMKTQNIGNARKRKLMGYLADYLAYHDNGVVSTLIKNKQIKMPRVISPTIRFMKAERVQFIHDVTLGMTGWKGAIARFITMAYPFTGLRPSELRTLKYKDLDQGDWIIMVTHPKGEDLYGENRCVGILPKAIPAFKEFLTERAEYLKEHGETTNHEALIPHITRKGTGYWSDAMFRKLKADIEQRAGVKFHLKDYRATFCQMCIDKDKNLLSDVSKTMGHSSTRTTEQFYGRIRNEKAIRNIRDAFKEPDAIEIIAVLAR